MVNGQNMFALTIFKKKGDAIEYLKTFDMNAKIELLHILIFLSKFLKWKLGLFVNLGRLELTYRVQTFRVYSYSC